jgi:hypothetical protein
VPGRRFRGPVEQFEKDGFVKDRIVLQECARGAQKKFDDWNEEDGQKTTQMRQEVKHQLENDEDWATEKLAWKNASRERYIWAMNARCDIF